MSREKSKSPKAAPSVSAPANDLGIPEFLRRPKDWVPPQEEEEISRPVNQTVEAEPVIEDIPERDLYSAIQKGIRDSASLTIAEFNGYIDDFVLDRESPYESPYDILVKLETKQPQAKIVLEHFRPLLAEALELKARTCPQLNEAYAFMSRPQINKYVELMQSIIDDTDRFLSNKKQAVVRGPRKKKVKSADKLVAGLKYLPSFPELKIVSIPPQQIIGAESVWLYNVKYRKLTKLVSRTREGLSVKGTTIIGFDVESSSTKTLRKPEIYLPKVLDGGKVILKNLMNEIKTTGQEVSGRVNSETILLRAIK